MSLLFKNHRMKIALQVPDSHELHSPREIMASCKTMKEMFDAAGVLRDRSYRSLAREWMAHNMLWELLQNDVNND